MTAPDDGAVRATEPLWRGVAEAHKRAMPMQRLLGNGMNYADAVELYGRVDNGQPWHEAAAELGDLDVGRARRALQAGH